MSFFFVKQLNKILLGHLLSINFLSLQLYKPTTKKHSKKVSISSNYVSPLCSARIATYSDKAKRTFLSANLDGSITVEASIVLPLFIFAIISVIYFFNLIYIQTTMQIHLENTTKLISSSTCVTAGANVNLNDDENSLLEKVLIDSAGTIAINALFLTDEIKDFADNTLIVNGSVGLSFLGSDVTNTDYPLDIILSYKVRMPFIPEDVFAFNMMHRCYFKPFNGKALSRNIYLFETYVYVTEEGTVFHASKFCSHLARFTSLRNLDELKKEYPNIKHCTFCSKSTNLISRPQLGDITYVFVTVEHDAYHMVEACPYLQRHLIRLKYEDAKQVYTPCNRCVVHTLN